MKYLSVKEIIEIEPDGKEVVLTGWIRTLRESKNVVFLEIGDGSTTKSIQAVFSSNSEMFSSLRHELGTGASVEITGRLVISPGQGQSSELQSEKLRVIGKADSDYVLQKKRHSFDFLRTVPHLRGRTNTFGAIFRLRSFLSMAVHQYFSERGFFLVHTPIITGSDCEGAGEMFQVTTLPLHEVPRAEGLTDYSQDFFGAKASLTVSGQLEGEALALALRRIYTFGPTFRAENSNTARHLSEFWMIEPEMAFCDISDNMELAEDFIRVLLQRTLAECPDEMEFFDSRIAPGLIKSLDKVAGSDFVKMSYTEAVDRLRDSGEAFEFPVSWGCDLQSEHEKFLTEKICQSPVILTDYPAEIKAFYMKDNADGKTVRAMDVLVPRLGEIIGGSERENDILALKGKMIKAGLNPENYRRYLDLRKYGSVPHAGFGLGFERLIQYVTGMQNIRDVIPYPRTPRILD